MRELRGGCFNSKLVSSSSEGASASTPPTGLEEEGGEQEVTAGPSSISGGGAQPSRKASRGQQVYWINRLSEPKAQEEVS